MSPLLKLFRGGPVLSTRQAADNALRERVLFSLESSGHRPLGCLHCRVQEGIVELSGKVPSYYMKQMAQTVVLKLHKVRGVRNLVRVD